MIDHALVEGLERSHFEHLPVPISALDKVKAVPADQFFALHEMLDNLLGPGFSARIGQEMKMDDYGVLGLSWKTCSQAKEIFERSERYFILLSNTYVFKVEQQGTLTNVILNRDAYRRGVELSNEATMSATVVVLRAMTESMINPVKVAFKHGPPSSLIDYEKAFQCPIFFQQKQNAITYRSSDLEMRTAKADASINKFLVERVEEETRGIEVSSSSIVMDVEQLIRDALPSGIPSVARLSKHMGMSNRTLTRRLAESDLTFRDLIKKAQTDIAKDLLRNTDSTMGEIAFQTGFSEQSAFSRAFKRWTGQSPAEFRKS